MHTTAGMGTGRTGNSALAILAIVLFVTVQVNPFASGSEGYLCLPVVKPQVEVMCID